MTRQEAEEAIMEKLREIWEICQAYAPQRKHVSMFFVGPHINLSNNALNKETDGVLDCFEDLSDGKGIYSVPH